MPTYRWLFLSTRDRLDAAGCDSPSMEAELLIAKASACSRGSLLAKRSQEAPQAVLDALEPLVARREKREPLAYILGTAEFYGREFAATSATLIPRSDTETLIEVVLKHSDLPARSQPNLLDLGTGTGCIMLTLLAELASTQPRGIAVDLSQAALKVCANNAESLSVRDRLTLFEGSWFDPLPDALRKSFDLIASNPPYVAEADEPELMPEVRDFEPRMALYAPGDGTLHYATLLEVAREWAKPRGWVALEMGYGQAEAIREMAERFDYTEISVHEDSGGIPRVLLARTPAQAGTHDNTTR